MRVRCRRATGPGRCAETEQEFQRRIEFLGQVPLFKLLPPSHYPILARELRGATWEAGQVVVENGARIFQFMLVAEGWAEVQVFSGDGAVSSVQSLQPGDYFGEKVLQTGGGVVVKSPARVVAGPGLVTLAMSPREFEEFGLRQHLKFPKRRALSRCVLQKHGSEICEKSEEERSFISDALRANENLRSLVDLQDGVIRQMIDVAKREEVNAGTQIVQRGEHGGMFYIVDSGAFELRLDQVVAASVGDLLRKSAKFLAADQVGSSKRPPLAAPRDTSETQRRMVRKERFLQKLDTKDLECSPSAATPSTARAQCRAGKYNSNPMCETPSTGTSDGMCSERSSSTRGSFDAFALNKLPNLLAADGSKALGSPCKLGATTPFRTGLVYARSGSLPDSHPHSLARLLSMSVSTEEDEEDEIENADGAGKVLGIRRRGECFGELALLYHAPRTSNAVAVEDAVVWSVSQAQFRKIMKRDQTDRLQGVVQHLGRVDLLQGLLSAEKTELAQNLLTAKFKTGDWLIKEGEQQQVWYIITRGECVMSRRKGASFGAGEEVIARLSSPNHFGERALLRHCPSEFSVRAVSECEVECLVLDGPTFRELAGHLSADAFRRAEEDDLLQFVKFKNERAVPKLEGFLLSLEKGSPSSYRSDQRPVAGSMVDPSTGARRLEMVGVLGRGAFGVVTLERDPTTGQKFALKMVSKRHIIAQHLQTAVNYERKILNMMDSPFIIRLHGTFKDQQHLYFLFEPLLGGELYKHMTREPARFRDPRVYSFVLACVTNALGYLHTRNVLFRDLKPENVLIGENGYLKLCDLGFAKFVLGKTHSLVGTPEYMSPEVIMMQGYDRMNDWWAVGILAFECVCGATPFVDEDEGSPQATFNNIIMNRDIEIPSRVAQSTADFISSLLQFSPGNRLGNGGSSQVKNHAVFAAVDWDALEAQTLRAPYLPKIKTEAEFKKTLKSRKALEAPEDRADTHMCSTESLDNGWDADF